MNKEEYRKHFGGVYKIFLEQMTKEKKRLVNEVKNNGDDLKVSQIKMYKKRVDLITELQTLYSIKIKPNSRRQTQINKIFMRYNIQ